MYSEAEMSLRRSELSETGYGKIVQILEGRQGQQVIHRTQYHGDTYNAMAMPPATVASRYGASS